MLVDRPQGTPLPGSPCEVITLKTAPGGRSRSKFESRARRSRHGDSISSMMASRRVWNSPREQGVVGVLNDCAYGPSPSIFAGTRERASRVEGRSVDLR